MGTKKHRPEEVVAKLRQVDVLVSQGQSVADAIRAIQITTRFPAVHGAPVHIGVPGAIGITDIARPDYGDAVPVTDDELPVFWACGVTPQAAIAAASRRLGFLDGLMDAAFR